MPDSTLSAIDRFFDLVDSGVEKVDHVINRTKRTEEKHHARRGKRPDVIDAEVSPKAAKTSPSTSTGSTASTLARKPRFYIVESIVDGTTLFVVTDGGNARAECTTRELAEKILQTLEKAP